MKIVHGMSLFLKSLLAIFVGAASPALPACGLHFCPRLQPEPENVLDVGVMFKQVGFDMAGTEGAYSELIPNIQYIREDTWVFRANLPLVLLEIAGAREVGISNPSMLAEYRFRPTTGNMLGIGFQLEIPIGSDEKGMAGNHFMGVPYASYAKTRYPFFFGGSIGMSFGIEKPHGHGTDSSAGGKAVPMYVNPHENFEALYRGVAGMNLWKKTVNPEVSLNGQQVLTEENESVPGKAFMTLGVSVPFMFGRYLVSPNIEVPISESRRLEWSTGLTAKAKF